MLTIGRVSACGMCSAVRVNKSQLLKAFNYSELWSNMRECYNQAWVRNLKDCGLAFLKAQSQLKAFIPTNEFEYTHIIMPKFACLLRQSISNAEFSRSWPTFAICMASVAVYFETYCIQLIRMMNRVWLF